mmetsp:Transcript_5727/g.6724  ORF Transcript_5727/g.6724 Transcript_5727/m.6724 type:complete len:89 (+) Transcript_5727:508-774(+)
MKGISTVFNAFRLGFIPPVVQLLIVVGSTLLIFGLFLYIICIPDNEEYQATKAEMDEDEREENDHDSDNLSDNYSEREDTQTNSKKDN